MCGDDRNNIPGNGRNNNDGQINNTAMDEQGNWQWQEYGTAWHGIGIYHVTLTIPSREPLLGTLVIQGNDPKQAYIERAELGKEIIHDLALIPTLYPEIRLVQYCLMPDHLHAILHVTRSMNKSIRYVIRGFWQGVKKAGRSYVSSIVPNTIRVNERNQLDHEDLSINPIFTEQPFIRPLSRRGQLQTMIRYVQMNPQRLATKRLKPGFFRVQEEVEIAGRKYAGVGNVKLLLAEKFKPVHVRSSWVEDAERHGYDQPLRDYMNNCVLAARQGAVMVSPFISKQEKMVQEVLLREKLPFILIADNGFRDYYKPADALFDAVAEGRVLILSPWEYDADKRHVTCAECVAMNAMAEEICETD